MSTPPRRASSPRFAPRAVQVGALAAVLLGAFGCEQYLINLAESITGVPLEGYPTATPTITPTPAPTNTVVPTARPAATGTPSGPVAPTATATVAAPTATPTLAAPTATPTP